MTLISEQRRAVGECYLITGYSDKFSSVVMDNILYNILYMEFARAVCLGRHVTSKHYNDEA